MPAKNWPLFFNAFWQSYLTTAGSQTAGVPDPAEVPMLIEQDREVPRRPFFLIEHERRPETLRRVYDARVIITLHTLEDDDTGTTAAQAEAWLTAVRNRVADRAAVEAYLATLPVASASDSGRGWQPAVLHVVATPWEVQREEKEGQASRRFEFTWTCVVEEP